MPKFRKLYLKILPFLAINFESETKFLAKFTLKTGKIRTQCL